MAAIDEASSDFEGFLDDDLNVSRANIDRVGVVDPDRDFSDMEISDVDSEDDFDIENEDTDIVGPLLDYGGTFSQILTHAVKFFFIGPPPGATVLMTQDKKEVDFFFLFFTMGCLEILVKETNLYAAQRQVVNGPDRRWREV